MPKYIFRCETCNEDHTKYVPVSKQTLPCPKCNTDMARQLPNIAGQEVRETVDPLTNVSWSQDQQAMIKKRNEDHYWEVEVPRLVQTYSLETCLEQKWLVYNDKGELVINKPPSKR